MAECEPVGVDFVGNGIRELKLPANYVDAPSVLGQKDSSSLSAGCVRRNFVAWAPAHEDVRPPVVCAGALAPRSVALPSQRFLGDMKLGAAVGTMGIRAFMLHL